MKMDAHSFPRSHRNDKTISVKQFYPNHSLPRSDAFEKWHSMHSGHLNEMFDCCSWKDFMTPAHDYAEQLTKRLWSARCYTNTQQP